MDVLVLIDKLDDLVHNAKAVPLTDQVRIDREEIYDILDQMRATIPEEIKQARWIVKSGRRCSPRRSRRSTGCCRGARAGRARGLADGDRQARRAAGAGDRRRGPPQAREMRLEMEDWADGILSTLEVNLDQFLTAVTAAGSACTSAQEHVMAGVVTDASLNE